MLMMHKTNFAAVLFLLLMACGGTTQTATKGPPESGSDTSDAAARMQQLKPITINGKEFSVERTGSESNCSCAYYGCGSCMVGAGDDGMEVVCYCGTDPNPHTRCDPC